MLVSCCRSPQPLDWIHQQSSSLGTCVGELVAPVGDDWDVGLWVIGIGDGRGSGGPVSIILQLQSKVHVAHPLGLIPPTGQPGEERRAPAVVGHLGTCEA